MGNSGLLRYCIVPVKIIIGNTSWMHEVSYDFEAVTCTTHNAVALQEPSVFSWSGITKFTGSLKPLASTQIFLYATFTHTGSYDVNRWKIASSLNFPQSLLEMVVSKLERSGGKFVQTPQMPQMIQIH
jgi:hypothetical protein